MRIRKYKKQDEKKIKNLIGGILAEIFGKAHIDWEDFGDYKLFYVAEDNGKIIGTIGVNIKNVDTVIISRLYVHKKYRSRGVGKKLYNKALKFTINNDFKIIEICTKYPMKAAINFYEKEGFVKKGENKEEEMFFYSKTLK